MIFYDFIALAIQISRVQQSSGILPWQLIPSQMSTMYPHFLYDRLNLFSEFYRQRGGSIRAIVNWDPSFQHFQRLTRRKYLKIL